MRRSDARPCCVRQRPVLSAEDNEIEVSMMPKPSWLIKSDAGHLAGFPGFDAEADAFVDQGIIDLETGLIFTAWPSAGPPCAWVLSRLKLGGHRVVARVTLDVAVRREFDYLVPEELEPSVHEGTRVKVLFGPREVMGW